MAAKARIKKDKQTEILRRKVGSKKIKTSKPIASKKEKIVEISRY